jgi:hypothetical protein
MSDATHCRMQEENRHLEQIVGEDPVAMSNSVSYFIEC